MAKSRTRQRKARRQRERQQRQMLYAVGGIVVVVVVGFALFLLANQPVEVEVDDALITRYEGLTRSVTAEGMPQIGDPDAPVVMHEYSSFTCGHCANFHDSQFIELLNNEVRSGELSIVFVPVPRVPDDEMANRAVFCALDQGAFWEMHDLAFGWLRQFGASAYSSTRFTAAAESLGLDRGEFSACLNAAETEERIAQAGSLWSTLLHEPNVTGTPTLTFNGIPEQSGGLPLGAVRDRIAELSQ